MKKFNKRKFYNDGIYNNDNLILFHLSTNHNIHILRPIIPQTAGINEDLTIPRICMSPSINGCISALQSPGSEYTVYTHKQNINSLNIKVPLIKDVFDSNITKEVWAIDMVPCIAVAKIYIKPIPARKVKWFSNYSLKNFAVCNFEWEIKQILDEKYRKIIESAYEYQFKYLD